MNDEQFIALALPHSVADDPHDGFHVSVYLSPKLIAGPNATLGDFPTLRDWASLANGPTGIEIELVSQAGTIPVTRIDRAVPADWKALFPHDTPVADATTPRSPDEPSPPQQVPDWSDRPWESYPVSETAGYAKALLLATILSDPVTPVPPSLHPITPSVVKFFDKHRAIDYGTREGYDTGSTRFPAPLPEAVGEMDREASAARRAYLRADAARDEAIVAYGKWRADYVKEIIFDTDDPLLIEVREDILTAALDSARTNRMYRSALAMLPPGALLDDQTAAAFSDLHETRRFYEEPDPDPTANRIQEQQSEPRPLPPRAPEFHERVAAAGARAAGDRETITRTSGQRAEALSNLGRSVEAIAVLETALAEHPADESPATRISATIDLGVANAFSDRLDTAREWFDTARRNAEELGFAGMIVYCIGWLGGVDLFAGRAREARAALAIADEGLRDSGREGPRAWMKFMYAEACLLDGDLAAAQRVASEGLTLSEEHRFEDTAECCRILLARITALEGQIESAREVLRAVADARVHSTRILALEELGILAAREGDATAAREHWEAALALKPVPIRVNRLREHLAAL